MTLPVATLIALFVPAMGLIAVACLIVWQIGILQRSASCTELWVGELSVDRYRPLFRMLGTSDIHFLAAQPGATPEMIRRFRQQRCEVFRGYLRCLERDFQRASQALMLVVIQSQSDRADLITSLVRTRLKFSAGLFLVRCRMVLYRWNVQYESITKLVDLFEGLQFELVCLTPSFEDASV